MKTFQLAVLSALLATSSSLFAQVKVLDQEYKAATPLRVEPADPRATTAVEGGATFDLPIDSAELMVMRDRPFLIRKGVPIHQQLEAWARSAGWEFIWYPSVSWKAIGDADMNIHKEISAAVEEIVNILRDEGKPIRLRISEGNRIMEVVSNEVRSHE